MLSESCYTTSSWEAQTQEPYSTQHLPFNPQKIMEVALGSYVAFVGKFLGANALAEYWESSCVRKDRKGGVVKIEYHTCLQGVEEDLIMGVYSAPSLGNVVQPSP